VCFLLSAARLASAILEEAFVVDIIQLAPDLAVAPQLVEADFAEIAARGFRSVVNNRPDGEAPDQLPSAQAAAAARRHGLVFRYQPVKNASATDDDVVSTFAQLMDELPGPILFYCRTGTRCTILWTQAAAPRVGVDAALSVAHSAGYDLEFLRDTLAERGDWLRSAPARSCEPALATLADR
jgi:sulfide:quinone oxidoreductase